MVMGDTESCSSRAVDFVWSESKSRKQRVKVQVYNEILFRLKQSNEEETRQPYFEDDLWAHFYRLPSRYALDVNLERAEDVLMHKRLLHVARDPAATPAIEVRLVLVQGASTRHFSNLVHSGSPRYLLMHEITISTNDKPKLLSQLTSLLSEIGLNIQEAHAFSTVDGYSLDVFVVDGWPLQETEQLRNVLAKEIPKVENHHHVVYPVGEQEQSGINHVNIPAEGIDVWEIDASLLKFEHKIVSGSYCDLYKGAFFSQDVAIKVLTNEHLNENIRREFAQEVHIMRKVRHMNVVQFIGACTRPPRLFIVTGNR
ncbi:hypothetical protein CICLE_v10000919mg [Citrus x clementina]|uniref:non-specific serine/threonine protein kinase n=1 Tax=Citrus clementina TaxID=85681 RepID=V4SL73_CITCL|nr:hypothetical protein CICLE_v10000919mg [Citrus x clementina]